jgi:hypothetical protein
MRYNALLDAIMSSDKDIRFSLVSDKYGNTITSRRRQGETNFLTEDETKDSLKCSVESWKVRKKNSQKIGMGKYALVEYEKITRLTMPIDNENLLLVTADNTKNPMQIVTPLLGIVSNPKLDVV